MRHLSAGLKIDEMEVTMEVKTIVLGLKGSEMPAGVGLVAKKT